jgi:hypothetical protein
VGAISDSVPDLWLKADSLGLSDGDAVGTWTDSSGNGYDATQATGSAKPTYKTNITLAGKPVVRFDGGDYLASSAPTDANGQTVIAVARPSSMTRSPTLRGANTAGGFQCRYNATGSKLQMVKQDVVDIGSSTSASSTSNFEIVA